MSRTSLLYPFYLQYGAYWVLLNHAHSPTMDYLSGAFLENVVSVMINKYSKRYHGTRYCGGT